MGGVVRGPSRPFPFAVGAVIGELTCIAWERTVNVRGDRMYNPRMRCSCGWEGLVNRSNVKQGRTTRCDRCAKKKAVETRWENLGYNKVCPDRTHRERLLTRISAIVTRCTNPESSVYPDYGGRGIGVHQPWVENRVEFLRYLVGLDGWDRPELQLDRTDNSRSYEPGNLRFVTRSVNMSNKRRISAREFEALKQRAAVLEATNADLRRELRRAKKQVHDLER